jgi:hypothetical protein
VSVLVLEHANGGSLDSYLDAVRHARQVQRRAPHRPTPPPTTDAMHAPSAPPWTEEGAWADLHGGDDDDDDDDDTGCCCPGGLQGAVDGLAALDLLSQLYAAVVSGVTGTPSSSSSSSLSSITDGVNCCGELRSWNVVHSRTATGRSAASPTGTSSPPTACCFGPLGAGAHMTTFPHQPWLVPTPVATRREAIPACHLTSARAHTGLATS